MRHVDTLIDVLLEQRAHKVTLFGFIDRKDVVTRVTHRLTRGRLPPPGTALDLVVSTGRPNFRERNYLRGVRKRGEWKPGLRWVQMPPKRRAG